MDGRKKEIIEDEIDGEREFMENFMVRIEKRKEGDVEINDKGDDKVWKFEIRRSEGNKGEDIRDRRIGDEKFG